MTPTTNSAILVQEVAKRYGQVVALRGISLRVERGEIVALLGPNGAGKSTLLKILSTLLAPDAGRVELAGIDLGSDPMAVRRRIGVTFQETVLDPHLTGSETLHYHGLLYGLRGEALRRRTEALQPFLGLGEAVRRKTKTYSGGMKRRLEIARALLTDPEILLLDEPTVGLDPQNRAALWDLVRQQAAEAGRTVLFSTHYMEEAEALAQRVFIIDQGAILAEGTPSELIGQLQGDVLHMRGRGDRQRLAEVLRAGPFGWVEVEEGGVRAGLPDRGNALVEAVRLAEQAGYEIEDVSVRRPSLNEVFLALTGRSLRD